MDRNSCLWMDSLPTSGGRPQTVYGVRIFMETLQMGEGALTATVDYFFRWDWR